MPLAYPPAPPRTEAQLREQTAQLLALPNFQDVLLVYTRRFYSLRDVASPVSKLIANEDRYRVLNFLYAIWAESASQGGDGSFTYGLAYEICRRGEVTPRLLKTTLAVATFAGFLDKSPNPADARSFIYRPTAAMLAFPQNWMLPAAEALDLLVPDHPRAERMQSDPAIMIHLYRSGGREFATGLQPQTMMPEFMEFCGQREGGSVLAMGLFLAARDGTRPPSRLELSRRFGLSKSQVAQVVAAGDRMGYLTLRNGIPAPTQKMFDSHAEWTALSLSFLGHHMWPQGYV